MRIDVGTDLISVNLLAIVFRQMFLVLMIRFDHWPLNVISLGIALRIILGVGMQTFH